MPAAVLALLVLKPGGLKHAEASPSEHGKKAKDGKAALPGPTLRLPDFVVHLRDVDADRYARMSFELELPDEKAKEGINARLPQIRDSFLPTSPTTAPRSCAAARRWCASRSRARRS